MVRVILATNTRLMDFPMIAPGWADTVIVYKDGGMEVKGDIFYQYGFQSGKNLTPDIDHVVEYGTLYNVDKDLR